MLPAVGWGLRPSAHSAVTEISFFFYIYIYNCLGANLLGGVLPWLYLPPGDPPSSAVAVDKQLLGATFSLLMIPLAVIS